MLTVGMSCCCTRLGYYSSVQIAITADVVVECQLWVKLQYLNSWAIRRLNYTASGYK